MGCTCPSRTCTAAGSISTRGHTAASVPDAEAILTSESVGAYKPDRLVFRTAVERLGFEPHEVLHVGDSEVDDVKGAKAAGLQVAWLNRSGRSRRADVPEPDFEIRDLRAVPLLIQRA